MRCQRDTHQKRHEHSWYRRPVWSVASYNLITLAGGGPEEATRVPEEELRRQPLELRGRSGLNTQLDLLIPVFV